MNRTIAPIDHAAFSPAPPAGSVELGDLLPTMLRRLEEGSLRYVVMRNYHGYPQWAYKPDIGLLIDHRDVNLFIQLFHQTCDELGYAFLRGEPGRNNVVLLAVRSVAQPVGASRLESVKVDARTYESFALTRWHHRLHPLSYKVFLDDTRRRQIEQGNCAFHVYEPLDEFIMLFKQWRRKGGERYRNLIVERLSEPRLRLWFCETIGATLAEPQQLIAAELRCGAPRPLAVAHGRAAIRPLDAMANDTHPWSRTGRRSTATPPSPCADDIFHRARRLRQKHGAQVGQADVRQRCPWRAGALSALLFAQERACPCHAAAVVAKVGADAGSSR
jgi:hypothetical protein